MRRIIVPALLALLIFCGCEQDMPELQGSRTIKVDGLEYEMTYIQACSFDMGATAEQGIMADFNAEYPIHNVQLGAYYIGVTEVTQGLWKAIMGDSAINAERQVLGLGDNLPVHNISWEEANAFVKRLAALTGERISLPTEAEWEYAARGGVQDNVYSGSSVLDNVGWNGRQDVAKVKTKASNNFGIYDMSGNVAEYCSDWYGTYTEGNQVAPAGPETGTYRVVRGGSIMSESKECRVSARRRELPTDTVPDCGFRLVIR